MYGIEDTSKYRSSKGKKKGGRRRMGQLLIALWGLEEGSTYQHSRIIPGFKSSRDVIKERTCKVLFQTRRSFLWGRVIEEKNTPSHLTFPIKGWGSLVPAIPCH